ncbi:MAG TPA: protein kinase [Rhodanobacteraceae bacterium]|jgi:serine/threonine-protein kinase|nr:protein kinase [Rhodanobacteraceae bacterium]
MADIDERPAAGGFSLPLAIKFFLGCAFLIALAVGAAVVVTYVKGDQIAERAVDDALATSSAVQKEFEQNRLEQLQLKVQLIASDPATAKYVAQIGGATSNLPGLSESSDRDTQSISDLLKERQSQFAFDLGIVMDAKGNVLGRNDQTEAFRESLADDPLVRPAIAKAAPFSGYWRQGDRLYQAAIMPLQQDQNLVGFILLAQTINNEFCQQVAKISGAQIAFWLPMGRSPSAAEATDGRERPMGRSPSAMGRSPSAPKATDGREGPTPAKRLLLTASSFDESGAKALQEVVATDASLSTIGSAKLLPRVALTFSGQRWIAKLTPTAAEGEAQLGSLLALTSIDRIVASYRDILNWVLVGGVASILVALLLSYLLAKGILRPVRTMALAAEQAAAGNYNTQLGLRGSDELARLSRAFDSLLSDLREKSDMEGYVGNLSRFLPDPGAEPVRAAPIARPEPPPREPAHLETVAVVGLEFRQFGKRDESLTPELALRRFDGVVESVTDVASAADGSAQILLGPRFALTFAGPARQTAALQAWSALRERLRIERVGLPAAALVSGEVIQGSIGDGTGTQSAMLGPVMLQMDRLLPEAAAGQLLLARGAGDEVKASMGADAVGVVQGAATGKNFYALAESALGQLPALQLSVPGAIAGETIVSGGGAAAATPRTAMRIAMTLDIGSIFGGRYRILSELGSGGMGIVYKAHDLELGDLVALKMLKPGMLADAEQLDRLKSEIRLARRITHPNVLRTFDFGEVDGRAYISMEYVRGLTLRYMLNETRRIPYSAGLRIARQLCAGLAAAHEVGILHRDIKPENLILEQTGNAKLMDFGIARSIRRNAPDHTQPGTFVGTPQYSAPEQLAGEEVDQRADIYASGVLMCEMFCGKLPYTGANTLEIYVAQMQQPPTKPSEYWPEIPPALEDIILRCLQKLPSGRFQSAEDLAHALAAFRA